MEWLYKMRVHYWEETGPGKRYQALRECKNRHPDFKGQYGLREVAKRMGFQQSTIQKFELDAMVATGGMLEKLVDDLGISMEVFRLTVRPTEKIVKDADISPKSTPVPASSPMPSIAAAVLKPQTPPVEHQNVVSKKTTSDPTMDQKLKYVVNHTQEALIISIQDGVLSIYEDSKENSRKGTWAPAADSKFGGTKLEPRKVPING